MLSLGPIPDTVRLVVQRLIAESRSERPGIDERLNGFLLTGGPTGCSFLDANGEVWNWCTWDERIDQVPDGTLKVGLVAIAAERVPELAAWLPSRTPTALDCEPCHGSGWLPPPLARLQCPVCDGMGWVEPENMLNNVLHLPQAACAT